MLKTIMYIVGLGSIALSIYVLSSDAYRDEYATSGLMLLSFGIVTLLVAFVLRSKKIKNQKG